MKKPGSYNGYNTSVSFTGSMIAPCGMNCGTCIAFMRPKRKCPGCRQDDDMKNKSCVRCIIKNCSHFEKTDSTFCFDCENYPCLRLKQLDKRYRTKYKTSFLENLSMIRENGMNDFLAFESNRRKCPDCGSTLSVHRDGCLVCISNDSNESSGD